MALDEQHEYLDDDLPEAQDYTLERLRRELLIWPCADSAAVAALTEESLFATMRDFLPYHHTMLYDNEGKLFISQGTYIEIEGMYYRFLNNGYTDDFHYDPETKTISFSFGPALTNCKVCGIPVPKNTQEQAEQSSLLPRTRQILAELREYIDIPYLPDMPYISPLPDDYADYKYAFASNVKLPISYGGDSRCDIIRIGELLLFVSETHSCLYVEFNGIMNAYDVYKNKKEGFMSQQECIKILIDVMGQTYSSNLFHDLARPDA